MVKEKTAEGGICGIAVHASIVCVFASSKQSSRKSVVSGLGSKNKLGANDKMDFYYTPQEVAMFLDTDDEQVLAWIHTGELTAYNVAKTLDGKRPRWRVSESDIGKFLLRRRNAQAIERRRKNEEARLKAYLK